jgi:hypothetical protein
MSPNWNFREILDVYPESDSFECVGIKECDDSKCFNKRPLLSDMDLSKAGKMLDDMDHVESLKTSFEYLDEVARNCLCVVHSDASIDQVVERWRNEIVLHMQKEIASNARPKTRRSVGRPRGSSQSLMAVVEEHKEVSTTSVLREYGRLTFSSDPGSPERQLCFRSRNYNTPPPIKKYV